MEYYLFRKFGGLSFESSPYRNSFRSLVFQLSLSIDKLQGVCKTEEFIEELRKRNLALVTNYRGRPIKSNILDAKHCVTTEFNAKYYYNDNISYPATYRYIKLFGPKGSIVEMKEYIRNILVSYGSEVHLSEIIGIYFGLFLSDFMEAPDGPNVKLGGGYSLDLQVLAKIKTGDVVFLVYKDVTHRPIRFVSTFDRREENYEHFF